MSDQPCFQSIRFLRQVFEIRLDLEANQFAGEFEGERVLVRRQNCDADEIVGRAAEPPENKPILCCGMSWLGSVRSVFGAVYRSLSGRAAPQVSRMPLAGIN